MGRPVNDLDFTTDATPDQVLSLLDGLASAVWTTGIEYGTVGAQIGGQPCEITTFRADRYDRISRNPVVAFGTSIADDLRRRDFSMNAMAVSVHDRSFVDPYGGLADLARGILATPATPAESFGDDPLRMLRAARFVSQLGVQPVRRGVRRNDRAGTGDRPDHRRAGAGRADQADGRRVPAGRPGVAGGQRPGRGGAARAAGAADGRRRARPAQGRLRAHPAGARPGHRVGRPGPGCGRPRRRAGARPGAALGRAAA